MVLLPAALLLLLPSLALATPLRHDPRAPSYPPADVKGPAPLQAWIDTYNAAKAKGLIPNIPPSVLVNGNPTYPSGVNSGGGSGGACSWTTNHCFGTYDVVDAPTGIIGISFDDGPQLASPTLYNFLQKSNQKATHFMIGSRILDNPSIFQQAITTGGHIAVHTWSHPYMTTLTDMQILGELGWTAQIIHDQAGLVPAFWRPPYGDIDNRVRAIAREVFGYYNVIWDQDTFDWCLTEGGGNSCSGFGPGSDAGLDAELQGFYHRSHSPGLIILEHELTSRSVGGFIRNYPTIAQQGWTAKAINDIWSVPGYQNVSFIGNGQNPAWNQASTSHSSTATASSTAASSSAAGVIPSTAPAPTSANDTVKVPTPTSLGGTVTVTAENVKSTSSSGTKTGGVGALNAVDARSVGVVGLLAVGLSLMV